MPDERHPDLNWELVAAQLQSHFKPPVRTAPKKRPPHGSRMHSSCCRDLGLRQLDLAKRPLDGEEADMEQILSMAVSDRHFHEI